MHNPYLLNVEDLTYKVGNKEINSGITFSVKAGDLISIIGPNGSGKSTLLRLISGELKPSSGRVMFKNKNILDWNPLEIACHRSVLSQSNYLSFPFKVTDIIKMGRYPLYNKLYGNKKKEDEIVQELLELFELENLSDRNYLTLSGGEMQRAQLARVFAQVWEIEKFQEKIIILDEPNSFLDIKYQIKLFELIRKFNSKGMAFIMVLHNLNHAKYNSKKVLMLKNAKLNYFGYVNEVINKVNISNVFDVDKNSNFYSQLNILN